MDSFKLTFFFGFLSASRLQLLKLLKNLSEIFSGKDYYVNLTNQFLIKNMNPFDKKWKAQFNFTGKAVVKAMVPLAYKL